MNHFERNFASIFGPESHRRELTAENNVWKRREQAGKERRTMLGACHNCRGIYPECGWCHLCNGSGVNKC